MLWEHTESRYSANNDCIELVNVNGRVVARFSRNVVIEMLSLLPPELPRRAALTHDAHTEDDHDPDN